uniref:Uncharacterized protein n=1 Tax=Ditylum brightwellii TaxID=49249 RepID=A0A7S4QME9_9STRA
MLPKKRKKTRNFGVNTIIAATAIVAAPSSRHRRPIPPPSPCKQQTTKVRQGEEGGKVGFLYWQRWWKISISPPSPPSFTAAAIVATIVAAATTRPSPPTQAITSKQPKPPKKHLSTTHPLQLPDNKPKGALPGTSRTLSSRRRCRHGAAAPPSAVAAAVFGPQPKQNHQRRIRPAGQDLTHRSPSLPRVAEPSEAPFRWRRWWKRRGKSDGVRVGRKKVSAGGWR